MVVTTAAHALRPLHSGRLAVLIFAGLGLVVLPGNAQLETAAESVRLTLSSQTVWQGEYGWCAFSADILQGRGGLSFRCGGAGPFGTASPGAAGGSVRRRALTDSETRTLRRLYEAATLFDGGHIGADLSASDLPFLILIVRSTSLDRRAVVLVVTGNPTFSSGPRQALFDWLIGQRQSLTQ
jgi:hypothetical protein